MPSESRTTDDAVEVVDRAADACESGVADPDGPHAAEVDGVPGTDPESERTATDGESVEVDSVEWGPVSHERLRSLGTGALTGVLGAIAVLVGAVAATVVSGLVAGEIDLPNVGLGAVAVAVGFALVLGVTTVPYLYVWYRESTVGEWSLGRLRAGLRSLRPGWTLAGLGAALVPIFVVPAESLSALWPLLWVVWLVPAVAQSEGTTVRIDPAEPSVERTYLAQDRTRTDDLTAVVRTRRIDLPWLTVFLLAYRGNAWYRSTPWLFVPSEKADAVESALDTVLAESDGPNRASVPERVTLAVLGSFSLVFGLAMAVAGGEGAAGLALALLTAPFSLLFLALAARL
ncbi:hypothetical protein EKH57_01780 [Halorubrum sp. BOL3-1]|uniref:hypothetical protein n=1 Tax=Halorubrum sp. BOL3-1 TaxID=2497325 RepID=UPI001004F9A9|nr:hypothetical protein [Halorubrum sp. BOL3-1]QAU11593.1 hypothetical protein EKH57_01780 [Halorubrum sp. BOL3-1]